MIYQPYKELKCSLQRDQVIQLGLEEQDKRPLLPTKDDEEKLVTKIATITLVLRRLGFDPSQINQCLKQVPELELEAAINWVSRPRYHGP